jgi:hypothetical protein
MNDIGIMGSFGRGSPLVIYAGLWQVDFGGALCRTILRAASKIVTAVGVFRICVVTSGSSDVVELEHCGC